MSRPKVTIDGNEAAAHIAYRISEVIAIYPITPSSTMGELADEWASAGLKNIWGTIPLVQEMQSEGGAAGVVHGALQTGSLTTTFTASQGLLLMIPNMYKIAGELTSTVFHIAARSLAAQALSIFGDHSDVMAARSTGYAMLCSSSVQEAMDLALVSHASALEARVPFLHFFDGFRTSHEVSKIEQLTDDDIRAMIREDLVLAHRQRGLSPDRPVMRGTSQNPDVYFQGRETVNPFYEVCPEIVQKYMDQLGGLTGRKYKIFEYYGAPDAERVIVLMGSGAEVAHETVDYLIKRNEKVGVLKVRLYRPFSNNALIQAVPRTVKVLSVLDRTKEPGAAGDPLYLDVVNAVMEVGPEKWGKDFPKILGGRYGLSSKEFNPAMVKGIFDEMAKSAPKRHFVVGINDDVSRKSIEYDKEFNTENEGSVRAVFYGLGADGTVSANKNSIKIIGEHTPNYAQGYFVYDSKKSGSMTISFLRFGPKQIRSSYLITKANFAGCHQFGFLERYDVLKEIEEAGVFLLNAPYGPDQIWDHLPKEIQETIIRKKLKFYVIDALKVSREVGLKGLINTIMQTCFFAVAGVLPREEAIESIKTFIKKTYGKKGEEILNMNFNAVDQALANLHEVKVPGQVTSKFSRHPAVPAGAPDFVRKVTARIIEQRGDEIPVSAMPVDGTFPVGTSQWEKRNIAQEIPVWEPEICIQCGKCVMVCPHAVIRTKVYEPASVNGSPATFKSAKAKDKEYEGWDLTIQVSPMDCTGCGLCVDVCPAKSKTEAKIKALNMKPHNDFLEAENVNWSHFLKISEVDRGRVKQNSVRGVQFLQPLFEFSGACAGCGETPYIKLVSQLFGDRSMVANATGCSSIYGGNLPTTPWTKNNDGRGPAWANSLFEDNAEFGLGFRLSVDKQKEFASELLKRLESQVGTQLVTEVLNANQSDEAGILEQRKRVEILKKKLETVKVPEARQLLGVADMLVKKSVWIIGGDGWAYDIGFGGLDHVLASGHNVNVLVLDTEVYSNTGGQCSKATPRGAVAKFAFSGKALPKKDLALIAMSYGSAYVARVAMGGGDTQTLKAFREAEAYDGPSLIIAFSPCIAHGYDLMYGMEQQKAAVQSGYWPLFRYNPERTKDGGNPLLLDSRAPSIPVQKYMNNETRFNILNHSDSDKAEKLRRMAQKELMDRWRLYERLAAPPAVNTKTTAG
ncbi:MAG: pyruvate:ferredoxin (flavodoxin) oxidoreductase, partial [Candidatus Omnitrophota bacterium]|nr:pyruvate:ferredoxin (flavodoxin) oxidoreductase [Candidatus Omnitrophota bacterium]